MNIMKEKNNRLLNFYTFLFYRFEYHAIHKGHVVVAVSAILSQVRSPTLLFTYNFTAHFFLKNNIFVDLTSSGLVLGNLKMRC